MKNTLIAFILLSSIPANAHEFRSGFSRTQTCLKTIYKEQYIPGTFRSQGYVKSWQETISVPCPSKAIKPLELRHYRVRHNYPITRYKKQTETCSASKTTTGGLLGGGLAAALSQKDAYGWSIPLGAVLGMGLANTDC